MSKEIREWMDKVKNFRDFLNEDDVSDKIWYHGSNKPVKKFLYSLIGKNSERISNYHGYGIYFISNIDRAKGYGDVITKVNIVNGSDILDGIVKSKQLLKVYNQLKIENIKLSDKDEDWYKNPTYGEYSILNDVEDYYQHFTSKYHEYFKNSKYVTDFLLRSGIDGMKVVNDVNDNILIVFNEKIINMLN